MNLDHDDTPSKVIVPLPERSTCQERYSYPNGWIRCLHFTSRYTLIDRDSEAQRIVQWCAQRAEKRV